MSDYMSPETLRARQSEGDSPTVIDVRGEDEFAAGHLPGAINIPSDELAARLSSIPSDRPAVTY